MLIIDSFGRDIYIDRELVGYIGENVLYIKGNKFADITDDGVISFGPKEIGYIEDDNSIIINGKEVGYIDAQHNFVFYNTIGSIKR